MISSALPSPTGSCNFQFVRSSTFDGKAGTDTTSLDASVILPESPASEFERPPDASELEAASVPEGVEGPEADFEEHEGKHRSHAIQSDHRSARWRTISEFYGIFGR
jgi:hypothetical protein